MRLLAALVVACVFAAAAEAEDIIETEPNDILGEANEVVGLGLASGTLANPSDVDFFVFTTLDAAESYAATIDNPFLGIGWFDESGPLLDSWTPFGGVSIEFEPLAAGPGGLMYLAVCGQDALGEFDCDTAIFGSGDYVLTLPEPTTVALATAAVAALATLTARRRTRKLARR